MEFPAWVKPPTPCTQHTRSIVGYMSRNIKGVLTFDTHHGVTRNEIIHSNTPQPFYIETPDFAGRVLPSIYPVNLDKPCGPGCVNL